MKKNLLSAIKQSQVSVFVVITLITIIAGSFFVGPTSAAAEGFVTCSGTDCSFCNLVEMINLVIVWLITILFAIFAIMIMVAGFGLVTSGGNEQAKSSAKSKFVNAIVGIVIVLVAWLLIDTIVRGLVGSDQIGGNPWSRVDCQLQVEPVLVKLEDLQNEQESNPDANTGTGTSVTPDTSGMVSLSSSGVNVASWYGITGPGRTDMAHPTAVAAAKAMQDAGVAKFGVIPFQVTAAYTDGVGHSAGSKHYDGIAIDFQPINGITKAQIAELAKDAGFTFVLVESVHVHADMR